MAIFRQYIAPFLIVLVFLVALVAVGARSFLGSDMAAPAPIEEIAPNPATSVSEIVLDATTDAITPDVTAPDVADLPPSLEALVHGLPADSVGTQL